VVFPLDFAHLGGSCDGEEVLFVQILLHNDSEDSIEESLLLEGKGRAAGILIGHQKPYRLPTDEIIHVIF
jgi:hypothetical protein